jgi:hypothetical protein
MPSSPDRLRGSHKLARNGDMRLEQGGQLVPSGASVEVSHGIAEVDLVLHQPVEIGFRVGLSGDRTDDILAGPCDVIFLQLAHRIVECGFGHGDPNGRCRRMARSCHTH